MMMNKVIALLKEEDGQSMVEYGIIVAVISVAAITAITGVGSKVLKAFTTVDGEMGNALGGGGGTTPPPAAPPSGGDGGL